MKENDELYAYVTPELKRGMIMNTKIKYADECVSAPEAPV